MSTLRVVVLSTLLFATSVNAQANAGAAALRGSIEGAWRQVDVRTADQRVTGNQPGFRLYVDGHYSLVRVDGLQPRVQPDSTATNAQLRAAWGDGAFTAQTGTYEAVDGQTITHRHTVAKNPSVMAPGAFTTSTIRMVGDTLWVTNVRGQAGPIANPTTAKYVRVR